MAAFFASRDAARSAFASELMPNARDGSAHATDDPKTIIIIALSRLDTALSVSRDDDAVACVMTRHFFPGIMVCWDLFIDFTKTRLSAARCWTTDAGEEEDNRVVNIIVAFFSVVGGKRVSCARVVVARE